MTPPILKGVCKYAQFKGLASAGDYFMYTINKELRNPGYYGIAKVYMRKKDGHFKYGVKSRYVSRNYSIRGSLRILDRAIHREEWSSLRYTPKRYTTRWQEIVTVQPIRIENFRPDEASWGLFYHTKRSTRLIGWRATPQAVIDFVITILMASPIQRLNAYRFTEIGHKNNSYVIRI